MLKESNILVSSATDGSINVFDLERHERLHSYEEAHKGKIISLDLSYPNSFIISASDKEFIMRPFSNQEKNNVSNALSSIETESKNLKREQISLCLNRVDCISYSEQNKSVFGDRDAERLYSNL